MSEGEEFPFYLDVDIAETKTKTKKENVERRNARPLRKKDKTFEKHDFGDGESGAWDRFYFEKGVKFFKDRHNLRKFFPELMPEDVQMDPSRHHPPLEGHSPDSKLDKYARPSEELLAGKTIVVEVGCGVGNATFPLLRANPNLYAFSFDFSHVAVDFLRASPEYDPRRLHAFVADATVPGCARQVAGEDRADFVTMVWTLSALMPESMENAVKEAKSMLKEGGHVLFRDYAVGDLAQTRKIGDEEASAGLFRRGDGTIAFFFDEHILRSLFESNGFKTESIEYVHRNLENKKQNKVMQRRWIQAKFRKP
mmetsp:Transcript_12299/g.37519  ORF Transcript_12299/g.37519 Transcript_12299/m.37519 type:complete len:310 (+) Transcript_12299:153-1082(+)|eukprot:CAMPEP_0198733026 /NCGR_PEP_ID=MMETSP1475-20131203/41995_1 /TAXON_ID= ORGANISM="Unidentified sp., Strain CCMP1999" /NCGR_SAMPLE_ID=MMETSP1475 /ASSEMBLY_ACC=CAM_ASM_001111 /LENGTH=309 /DNA_ID=CAMNT_0044496249 /DNA_START=49 /DNA_END=978 /DNA_ORIENTATION=-